MAFIRPQAPELARRIKEPRRFIQVAERSKTGRQNNPCPASRRAEQTALSRCQRREPTLRGPGWIESQWEEARLLADNAKRKGALLVLDEVHKVPHRAETY